MYTQDIDFTGSSSPAFPSSLSSMPLFLPPPIFQMPQKMSTRRQKNFLQFWQSYKALENMPVVAEHFNPSLASPSPICKYLSFKCLTHFSSKKWYQSVPLFSWFSVFIVLIYIWKFLSIRGRCKNASTTKSAFPLKRNNLISELWSANRNREEITPSTATQFKSFGRLRK